MGDWIVSDGSVFPIAKYVVSDANHCGSVRECLFLLFPESS